MKQRTADSSHLTGARVSQPVVDALIVGERLMSMAGVTAQSTLERGIAMGDKEHGEQPNAARGYRPLVLTLTGFKGIRSGLGRDTLRLDVEALAGDATLVAIAGANGRGKTTVMDNLHPYLVMPSRAGADGLGAFSYYDHVFLPESQKELTWEHRGHRYKSQLVFRVNGKRKTEAFLFEQADGHWKPVVLADGTVSDGKVDIYEQAVRELLGSPETFFTSVFSAQGKRPLSAYRNGEIKGLLADLLGLDQVRQQGEHAAETARLLKNGLALIRQEQAGAAAEIARLAGELSALGDPEAALSRATRCGPCRRGNCACGFAGGSGNRQTTYRTCRRARQGCSRRQGGTPAACGGNRSTRRQGRRAGAAGRCQEAPACRTAGPAHPTARCTPTVVHWSGPGRVGVSQAGGGGTGGGFAHRTGDGRPGARRQGGSASRQGEAADPADRGRRA